MAGISVEFRTYRRRFRAPFRAAWGEWHTREGALVRVATPEGRFGYGEVAPSPWPATESLDEARAFLAGLEGRMAAEGLPARAPPACRYALESAIDQAIAHPVRRDFSVAALLPPGEAALAVFDAQWREGYEVFKWKIGVAERAREQEIFQELLHRTENGRETSGRAARFRLDANGALSPEEAAGWLERLNPNRTEFLEQPLPVGQDEEMIRLAAQFQVPLALDESVTLLEEVERLDGAGWPGLFVIKPSWLGRRSGAADVLSRLRERLVFSSAFETAVGVENALQLAAAVGGERFALGFGTGALLEQDRLTVHENGPSIAAGKVLPGDLTELWDSLGT